MTTLALAPMIILIISAIIATIAGQRKVSYRNTIIVLSFVLAILVNTYFLFLSFSESFEYVKVGELVVNAASLCISELVLILSFLGALYSFSYIEERAETWVYYLLFQLFTAMMVGMVSSFNILVIYIFLEASSVTSAILVMFSRRRSSILAAYRYLALSVFGGIIIITGIFLQYQMTHDLNLAILSTLDQTQVSLLGTVYLLGFGIKAGLLPFGLLWLPPAHSEAPIPIHTLLSAALVQVAAFDIARILGKVIFVNNYIASLLVVVGLASMLTGSIYALVEAWFGSKYTKFHVGPSDIRGIKRVWAFSTISEVGYIVLFLGLAGILTSHGLGSKEMLILGFGGAMLHMYNHGLSKSQLLFDSGVLIKMNHAEDLNLMGSLSRQLPLMRISFVAGAFSLGLLPGTFGVTTLKELIFNSNIAILTKTAVIMTAAISLIACLSVWYYVFFSKLKHHFYESVKISKLMYLPGLVMAIAIIFFGVYFTLEWIGLVTSGSELTRVLRIVAETTIKMRPEI